MNIIAQSKKKFSLPPIGTRVKTRPFIKDCNGFFVADKFIKVRKKLLVHMLVL